MCGALFLELLLLILCENARCEVFFAMMTLYAILILSYLYHQAESSRINQMGIFIGVVSLSLRR
jgi:hypothetical protein